MARRRPARLLLAAAVLCAASCSSDDGADEDADGVTTTTPATSTSAFDDETPATEDEALAGADGDEDAATPDTSGSPVAAETERPGCAGVPDVSPAVFDELGGVYAAHLTAIDAEARTVDFDVIQWFTGEAATAAYQEDFDTDGEPPPNGFHIRNENSRIRTASVAVDAEIWIVAMALDQDADVDRTDWDALVAERAAGFDGDVYWLTFDDAAITEVCGQFIP